MIRGLLIGLAASMLLPAAGQAQQSQPLSVKPGKPFTHKHTKLQFPAELYGIQRTRASALEADELDVSAAYDRQDEAITLYIYRDISGALPVWFDRATWAIETRPKVYGTLRRSARPLPFVPPRQSAAAGLIATYAASDSPFRSTGVALMPLDGWFVKIRYSSASLDADALDTRMRDLIAGLKWPKTVRPESAVAPVAACADTLAFDGAAVPLPATAEAAMIGSVFAIPVAGKGKAAAARQPVVWCRDDGVEPKGIVYRPDGAKDAYMLAPSDAGRGIMVATDPLQQVLAKDGPPGWSIKFQHLSRTLNYRLMDRLPAPTQVIDHVNKTQPISTVTTWGKNRSVQINADVLEKK
ncbi:hypothetical protein [Sphingomonas sanxanigenens]|uniref:hypothetical protein n=1 Tax=Sphingomonas sanxanigenens TaxID=397260 RepID=UPI00130186D4|nr:hypothetical protein [Sphingomonas sanxanigenens]